MLYKYAYINHYIIYRIRLFRNIFYYNDSLAVYNYIKNKITGIKLGNSFSYFMTQRCSAYVIVCVQCLKIVFFSFLYFSLSPNIAIVICSFKAFLFIIKVFSAQLLIWKNTMNRQSSISVQKKRKHPFLREQSWYLIGE